MLSMMCVMPGQLLPVVRRQPRRLVAGMVFCYCLLSWSFRTATANNNEFNNQIMPRVLEKIDTYLIEPINILWNIKGYRDLELFEYGLTIADHTRLVPLLYQSSIHVNTGWWIALEDGTVFYPYNPPVHGMEIREPGQSGYNIQDASKADHPYHKHLISCVNETDGEPEDCIADVGMLYVECVNDCELIPCPNATTTNTDNVNDDYDSNSSDTTTTSADDVLSSLPKWCSNYIVKEVQPDEEGLLGYIPSTFFCINVIGQPEQRPGYVLTGNNTLGNCYYEDGVTIVNRTLSGRYAFCGPNRTCHTAFAGGMSSYEYDARYRPWYIEAKLAQQASWSEPFVGFDDNTIGIQYTLPLYSYQNRETGTIQSSLLNEMANASTVDGISVLYRQIFAGLLVSGTDLGNLTKFLIDEYAHTTMKVFIVEHDPNVNGTNYMIASSTGHNVKRLLLSNLSQPCPEESLRDSNVCTIERLAVQELGGDYIGSNSNTTDNEDDVVFYRAFIEFEKLDFPTNRHVDFRINDDDVYSKAYVAQTESYHQPNLYWRVFVVLPMDRSSDDAITAGNPTFALVCVLATLGLLGCLFLLMTFYQKRTEKAVINADWRFTCAFILGCAILNLSSFVMLGDNTNALCMLRMWSFNGLFVSALSPLFVKVWRMSKLMNASTGFKRTNVTNFQAFLYTLPFIAIEVIILMIFSFVDPPRQTEALGVGVGIGVQQITCQQNTNAFFITQMSYCAILVFIGCVLAYITRDLNPKFGEAKQLGFSMYNIAFTGSVAVAVINLVDINKASQIILQAVCVLWGTVFCSLAFVLPRLMEVSKDRKNRRDSTASSISGMAISGLSGISQSGVTPSWVERTDDPGSSLFRPNGSLVSFKYEDTSTRDDDATSRRGSLTHPIIITEALLHNHNSTNDYNRNLCSLKSFPTLDEDDDDGDDGRVVVDDDDLDYERKALNDHHDTGGITTIHEVTNETKSSQPPVAAHYLTEVSNVIDGLGLQPSSLHSQDDMVHTAATEPEDDDT